MSSASFPRPLPHMQSGRHHQTTSELDIIEQNYRLEGIQRCLIELFKCFQSRRNEPVSWNNIVTALTKMHNNNLADQICHKYVWNDPSQHPPSRHTSEGQSLVTECNTQVKDTGSVSKTNDDILLINPRFAKHFNKITTSFASLVLDIRNTLQRKLIPIDEIQVFFAI